MKSSNRNNTEATWTALVKSGKEAGRNKNLKSSAEKFAQAYETSRAFPEQDSRRGESAYYLAYTRYLEHDNSDAIRLFEEALNHMQTNPDQQQQCAQIHSLLAAIFFGEKELEIAERHLRKSLELEAQQSRESWENIQLLSSVLVALRKYDEAIPVLEKLIEYQKQLHPQEVTKSQAILSFVHSQLGNRGEERKWLKAQLLERERLSGSPSLPKIDLKGPPPDGWGGDRISHFIESVRRNQFSTFANLKDSYDQLLHIDERFWSTRRNLTLHLRDLVNKQGNMKFESIRTQDEDWLEIYFFMRTHASFLGATGLALGAQIPETYAVLRACLENAMYGFYVFGDTSLKKIWLDRYKGDPERKKVRDLFTVGKMDKALEAKDAELAKRVSQLYNTTIDDGAHPNVNAFFANSLQKNENKEITLAVAYLNPGELKTVLSQTIATGETVFDIFALTFPDFVAD